MTLKLFSVGAAAPVRAHGPAAADPGGAHAASSEYRRDFLAAPVLFFATWLFLFTLHWGAEATSLALFLEHNLGL